MKSRILSLVVMLALLTLLAGCGGGGGSSSGSGSGTGTLALSLTDDSVEGYNAIYVTIEKVQVHLGGDESKDSSWKTVSDVGNNKTYDLLVLRNGVREELGITDLDVGPYTQMRLILGRVPDDGINVLSRKHPFPNYAITDTDEVHELKVPSGFQTGIKIVQGFDISKDQTTELILDFDAARSVVKAGNSGNWLLKPTIKVAVLEEHSIVRGVVTDGTNPVPGALVSAQQFDDNGTPPDNTDDTLEVFSTTLTDALGEFALFLNPNSKLTGPLYNIVASKTGYKPKCVEVVTEAGKTITLAGPITTGTAKTGTLTGTVSISGADSTQFVTLSFRQNLNCDATVPASTIPVEVKSENFANLLSPPFNTELTEGEYDVNASTNGFSDKQYNVTISESTPADLEILFPN